MLYIKKMQPLPEVVDKINLIKRSEIWKNISEEDTKAIRMQFESLPKDSIRYTLLKEQHGLCAYCMRRIHNDSSTTIEHWAPLSKNKEQALQYSNFLGVCHGGRKSETDDNKILCCDASKEETAIRISPWNEAHIRDIAYTSAGIIYTLSGNPDFEEDINKTLCLNGLTDNSGNFVDTSTEIVKGRRDSIQWCKNLYKALDRQGKCTSLRLKKKIEEIEQAEIMPEYAGVKLFYLKKKYWELLKRGK